ncbi:MAG: 4'-phosphopantetheinyl transferase superfamily protein [Gammaproteobacteria bacterium]|jgi:4'-phosphopantetheinyl transferase|nr:4'-phosphopantetheinyl transferase superfamily protein [Gammaproteobacteria bacterium]
MATSLAMAEAHLYFADLDECARQPTVQCVLGESERRRSQAMTEPLQRARFITARTLLREQLARYTSCAAEILHFEILPHGKPQLSPALPRLSFNVSHAGPVWLLGVSSEETLGVDIERKRPLSNMLRLAQRVFSDAEQAELIAIKDHAEQEQAFLRGWTRKEAALKALGTGFSLPARRVHVGLAEGGCFRCSLDSTETLYVYSGITEESFFWSVAAPSPLKSLKAFRLTCHDYDSHA